MYFVDGIFPRLNRFVVPVFGNYFRKIAILGEKHRFDLEIVALFFKKIFIRFHRLILHVTIYVIRFSFCHALFLSSDE